MSQEQLEAYYDKSYRDALACWLDEHQLSVREVSRGEAAYTVLENAALLLRLRGAGGQTKRDGALPQELAKIALNDKVRLVQSACDYAASFSLPAHFSRLLITDILDAEEIEEIELVLCQIDGLDAVVSLSGELVRQTMDENQALLSQLAQTRCLVADLVQQLSERMDIVSVASRFLLVQRRPRYTNDGRPADWFTRFREWDQEPTLPELLPQEPHEFNEATIAANRPLKTQYAPDDEYAMAAADDVMPLNGVKGTARSWETYLIDHVLEILQHGNSSVWFEIDSERAPTSHTYDKVIADTYSNSTGPHRIPAFVNPANLLDPDVETLLNWLASDLRLAQESAEHVWANRRRHS